MLATGAAGLIALQPPIVNLDLQPIVGADTAHIDTQARRAPVAMLDRIDTRLAKRGFQILDPLAVAAKPSGERGHGFASDFFVA